MTVREHFQNLAFQGRFGEALRLMRESVDVDRVCGEDAVLYCELLQAVGRWKEAESRTAHVLSDISARPDLVARIQMLLALICRNAGKAAETFKHLQAAIQSAESGNCRVESAWARVRYLTDLAAFRDLRAPLAALPATRRAVRRAGDAGATVALHLTVAEIDTRSGALNSAKRHIEIAEDLLKRFPIRWLDLRAAIARICLHYIEGNLTDALAIGERALALAKETEHLVPHAAALTNIGQVQCETGRLNEAEASFRQALSLAKHIPGYRPAALDGLAQVALLSRQYDRCRALLSEFDAAVAGVDSAYYNRYVVETKARLLASESQWDAAAALIENCIARSEFQQDVQLLSRLTLFLSRCFIELRRTADAATLAMSAATAGLDFSRSGTADVLRVLGRGLSSSDPAAAATLYRRALCRYEQCGNTVASEETRTELEGIRTRQTSASVRDPIFATLQSATELISVGDSADALVREAARFMSAIGASASRMDSCAGQYSPTGNESTAAGYPSAHNITLRNPSWGPVVVQVAAPSDFSAATNILAIQELATAAADAARARRIDRERMTVWPAESLPDWTSGVYASDAMKELLRIAERIASTPITVLITGETGTGKEVLAKTIHDISERRLKPFAAFNCAAVPRDIMESQLFGFKKGSFTGALDHSTGIIRAAEGGTILLDEVGEICPELQPKLLRFLESSEIHPIGEARPVKVNVRIIAATNANIDKLVAEGRFREDLYYRLNVIRINVPPLRERREEIPLLVDHFIERFTHDFRRLPVQISDDTMEYLLLYSWPGNLRQLANEVRRILALAAPGSLAGPELLSPEILGSRRTVAVSQPLPEQPPQIVIRLDQPMEAATDALARAMIRHALQQNKGRVEDTARQLGLSRKGLYLKRMRFGLDASASSPATGTGSPASA